jgi:lipopolysaccharide export system protein LptA
MLKCLKYSILITVFSLTAAFAIDLSKVKIISAEKLDYKDGNSVLIGNVKVQLGDYFITAPKVFIDSDDSGKPSQARFIEDVTLESEEINIHAPRMVIDLQNTILKCYSSDQDIVQTTLTDKNNKQAVILTWYQEFNYQTGFAQANSQKILEADNVYQKKMNQVIFVYDTIQVESNDIEMQLDDGNVEYAVFLGDAVAVDENQRTEAQEIYFFPDKNLLKAEQDVRIVYADKEAPAYIFSDVVIYEKDKNILSAFSTSNKPNSKIYRVNAFGQGRQIILNLDDKQKPDNAILTGSAYSQIEDKALSGHELLFDIKNQSIKTLVGRPKTLLFSKNQPGDKKKKSDKS